MSQTETDRDIRWLIRRDLDEVIEVDRESFEPSQQWDDSDFTCFLRQRNAIGIVITDGHTYGPIAGFAVYELYKQRLELRKMAVHPKYRRQGYGTSIVFRLANKLTQQRRFILGINVPERNLEAQLFFSRCGMIATPLGDVIRMEYFV